jgi:hypothetical protein
MPTPHDLQLYDPDGTAKVIDELAPFGNWALFGLLG